VTSLADIRAGIKTALASYFPDAQISGYILNAPTPPFFDLSVDGVDYDQAYVRGHDLWRITVRAVVQKGSDIGAQIALDEYLDSSGSNSVKQALETDQTLGGVVETCRVVELKAYTEIGLQGAPYSEYLCAEWNVEVRASGS